MNNKYKLSILALAFAIPFVGLTAGVSANSREAQETIASRVSEILGVSSDDLSNAFKTAHIEQIDAKVANGELSEDRANEMKERINNEELFLGPIRKDDRKHMHKPGEHLQEFLNVSEDELKEAKEKGTTVEELIVSKRLTIEDFVTYVREQSLANIQEKVESGEISEERASDMIERINERYENALDRIQNGESLFPERGARGDRNGEPRR